MPFVWPGKRLSWGGSDLICSWGCSHHASEGCSLLEFSLGLGSHFQGGLLTWHLSKGFSSLRQGISHRLLECPSIETAPPIENIVQRTKQGSSHSIIYDLALDIMYHHFCFALAIQTNSHTVAGMEFYQGMGIKRLRWGRPRSWLLQPNLLYSTKY